MNGKNNQKVMTAGGRRPLFYLVFLNEYCSKETLEYVKEQVKKVGEQAVKKYEKKIERKAKNQQHTAGSGSKSEMVLTLFLCEKTEKEK